MHTHALGYGNHILRNPLSMCLPESKGSVIANKLRPILLLRIITATYRMEYNNKV